MQRPRPERKESAARTRSQASAPHVDVIVLTADPALLATLRDASGPAHNLLQVETPEAAVDLLVSGHCGIFILDIAVVRHDVVELIEKLQAQFPEVLLLATGRRDEQQAVTGLVGSGRIYRFLHKPISPARAELFLSTATRRYGELHPRDGRSRQPISSLGSPRTRLYSLIAIVAVASLGAITWWWSSTPEAPAPVIADAPSTRELDEVLERADAAYAAGSLTAPAQANAVELYREALRIETDNEHALERLDAIVATLERNTREALSASDTPRARTALAALQFASPDHPRLNELRASLSTLARQATTTQPASTPRAQLPAPTTVPAPAPTRPTISPRTATPNVDLARAYLAANQLTEPSDASALHSLREARAADEDEGAVKIAATDLGTRLLNRALAALEANDLAGAKNLQKIATDVDREFETTLPDLDLVASRISEAEATAERAALATLLARAARLRQSGQLIEPAGDNAVEALNSAVVTNASSAEVKAEQQRLSFALLESTRTALAAGDIDRADILATKAEEVSPGLPQTRALREQIGAARVQREESTILQAAGLTRTREVPAIYPRDALLNSTQGWVDLEFTINTEGVPTEIRVKASSPPRTFDVAATQALRQWRFAPILRNGAPQARRAVLRMEFKLKNE